MKHTHVRGYTLFTLVFTVLALSFMFSPVTQSLAEETAETTVIEAAEKTEPAVSEDTVINVKDLMKDHVMGDENAPVTVIEYASMTCMHCANFHNTVFPYVKSELIDTGKVKFIFREFPLDGVALRASMMARCAPADKFHSLIEVLFAQQKRWVGADNPVVAMSKLGKLAGVSDERLAACLSNTELESALLRTRQDAASTYSVKATPTFVFNNGAEVESGVLPIDEFKKIVEKLAPAL
jgi:protein-disulfide isomerase